jgi:CO/xanthine dehydrogenase FAD-binding subunit
VVPQSLKEAITLISEYQEKAGILAGGADLLDRIKKGQRRYYSH